MWIDLITQLMGLVGFCLMLAQGVWDLRRRRHMAPIHREVERMASDDDAADAEHPASAGRVARRIAEAVDRRLERYRPWQGRSFLAGAGLLALVYLVRIAETLATWFATGGASPGGGPPKAPAPRLASPTRL